MSNYASFNRKFWSDNFVVSLTPEEKYFYIYLFTNTHVSTCGIYPLPRQNIVIETGYNSATVDKLLNRFVEYGKVKYSTKTNEICLINFIKNTYVAMSYQQAKGIMKSIDNVEDIELLQYIDTATIGKTITSYIDDKCNNIPIIHKEEKVVNKKSEKFIKPSIDEIQNYCQERGNHIDAENFYAFYESKGWKIGNSPMKCWKSAVITWEKRMKTVKPIVNKDYKDEFNRLYDVYPVKSYYAKSLNEYNILKQQQALPNIQELINIVELFKRLPQWQDIKFIPSLYNWLKDKRYEDDLSDVEKKKAIQEYDLTEDYMKDDYVDEDI